jgi:glucose-6-phosphate 1-dehydrogenase
VSPRQAPDPCIVVIFGASGDLTSRKLFPALHNLHVEGLMPDATSVLGTSRTPYSDEQFAPALRESLEEHSRIKPTDASWESFTKHTYHVPGDATDPELQQRLN